MKRQRFVVIGAMALILAGCGRAASGTGPTARTSASPSAPADTASPTAPADAASPTAPADTASPSPSPTTCVIPPLPGLCVGRAATSQEEAAMIAVGKPPAERALGVQDASACTGNQSCFFLGTPSRAMVATNAGTFYGGGGGAAGTCLSAG